MVDIHKDRKEVHVRIVYFGPGGSGVIASLKLLERCTFEDDQLQRYYIDLPGERMLHLVLVPESLPKIHGSRVHLHLYEASSSLYNSVKMEHAAEFAHGIVFVADSMQRRREANVIQMEHLIDCLALHDKTLADTPLVLQYNKRDFDTAMSLEELRSSLNPDGYFPEFETSVIDPEDPGVFNALKTIVRQVLSKL